MLTIRPAISNYSSAKPSFGEKHIDPEYAKKRAEYESYKTDLDEAIDNEYVPSKAKTAFKIMKIGVEGLTAALAVTYGAKKSAELLGKAGTKFKKSSFYIKTAEIFAPMKKGIGDAIDNAKNFFHTKYENFMKKKWVAKKVKSVKKFFKKNSIGKKLASMYNTTKEFISKKYKAAKDFFKGVTYKQGSEFVAGTLGAGSGIAAAYAAGRQEFPVSENDKEIKTESIDFSEEEIEGDE